MKNKSNTAIAATPCRLADGTWGARAHGAKVGDYLEVVTRTRKRWIARVVSIETATTFRTTDAGEGYYREAVIRKGSSTPKPVPTRGKRCRMRGCSAPATLDASYHPAEYGFCGACAYDEV